MSASLARRRAKLTSSAPYDPADDMERATPSHRNRWKCRFWRIRGGKEILALVIAGLAVAFLCGGLVVLLALRAHQINSPAVSEDSLSSPSAFLKISREEEAPLWVDSQEKNEKQEADPQTKAMPADNFAEGNQERPIRNKEKLERTSEEAVEKDRGSDEESTSTTDLQMQEPAIIGQDRQTRRLRTITVEEKNGLDPQTIHSPNDVCPNGSCMDNPSATLLISKQVNTNEKIDTAVEEQSHPATTQSMLEDGISLPDGDYSGHPTDKHEDESTQPTMDFKPIAEEITEAEAKEIGDELESDPFTTRTRGERNHNDDGETRDDERRVTDDQDEKRILESHETRDDEEETWDEEQGEEQEKEDQELGGREEDINADEEDDKEDTEGEDSGKGEEIGQEDEMPHDLSGEREIPVPVLFPEPSAPIEMRSNSGNDTKESAEEEKIRKAKIEKHLREWRFALEIGGKAPDMSRGGRQWVSSSGTGGKAAEQGSDLKRKIKQSDNEGKSGRGGDKSSRKDSNNAKLAPKQQAVAQPEPAGKGGNKKASKQEIDLQRRKGRSGLKRSSRDTEL